MDHCSLAKHLDASNQEHLTGFITVLLLLLEKGLVSTDEVDKAHIKAIHLVEQELASQEDQNNLDNLHPGLRKFLGMGDQE